KATSRRPAANNTSSGRSKMLEFNHAKIDVKEGKTMRWRDYGQSSNVEDRRGLGGRGLAIGGGGIGVLVLLVAALVCGVDPRQLLENLPTEQQRQQPGTASDSINQTADENRQFVGGVDRK